MTIEEYNALKKIDTASVIERMRKSIKWIDENEKVQFDDDLYMVFACFILWKLKNKGDCFSSDEYFEKYAGEERSMSFDDVPFWLDDGLWSDFLALKDQFSDEELKAAVLLTKCCDWIDPTSEGLLSLADRLLDIQDGDKVTEYCSSDFGYAVLSKLRHNNIKMTAYEDSYTVRSLGEIKKQVLQLDNMTVLGQVGEPEISDKLFIDFGEWETVSDLAENEYEAKGAKAYKGLPEKSSFLRDVIISAICSMRKNGKAVIMVRAGQLSGKENEQIRKYLVDKKLVSGVVALTEKLYEKTWVNTYMLILEKNSEKIRFCDARDVFEKGRITSGKQVNQLSDENIELIISDYESGSEFSRIVATAEISENDYILLPQRYVRTKTNLETVRIEELVRDLRRGITLSAAENDTYVGTGSTKCITPMSLSNGVIAKAYYFDEENFQRKVNYAHRGDLLINKSGKPIRTAVADDTYVVIGNIYILSINYGSLDPYYIKCFLESPNGQAELMKYAVGENSPMLTVANVQKVEIPVYDKDEQNEMERRSQQYTRALQEAIYKMDELQEMFE